ncbi:MAG: DUF839 domain-containing protein [Polyangiaceae bacterium]
MVLARRSVLKWGAAAVAAGLPIPFVLAKRRATPASLVSDPEGVLDLAPGLHYQVLSRTGETMSDGFRVPGAPDGMACFDLGGGRWALMRNHEVDNYVGQGAVPPGKSPPAQAFDKSAHGGVTRIVLDAKSGQKLSENLVLTGTVRNCAGGTSPWGWLSCEETIAAGHGFVFLCRTDAASVQPPRPLTAYGRFNHEAALVDPATLIAYLSEDRSDGCLYRFVPKDPSHPFEGRLQALRLVDHHGIETTRGMKLREEHRVDWVDIAEPAPKDDSVRLQGHRQGAAKIRRGEGLALHDGTLYLVSTTGGKADVGQIFALNLRGESRFSLRAESPHENVLDCPDNVTVAPWGDILVAEDGSSDQFLRGITPEGRVYDLAHNARSRGEFTGVCLSPDARFLFVNLQREGLTFAISGDFRAARARARGMV